MRRLALLVSIALLFACATSPATRRAVTAPAARASCGTYAGQCGERTPAVPAPACIGPLATAVECVAPGAVRLWPSALRPGGGAGPLPPNRDSTHRYQGICAPGAATSTELWRSLDIAGDLLFAAYNAGIQAWDIAPPHAEAPRQLAGRDGWLGQIWAFPGVSEQLNFVQGISALQSGGRTFIAASGVSPVGTTLWEWAPESARLVQLYQDGGADSRDVRLFEHLGRVYAVGAARAQHDAVVVYDVTAASELRAGGVRCCRGCGGEVLREPGVATACDDLAPPGTLGPRVRLGALPGSPRWHRYVDVEVLDGLAYLVTASAGSTPRLWSLRPGADPAASIVRWEGAGLRVAGPELFVLGASRYLAWVRSKTIEIYLVDHCLDGDGCASLGAPLVSRPVRDVPADEQFLTFSTSVSGPYLYYGVLGTGGLRGRGVEQLLDLSGLGAGVVTEITSDGGAYLDPGCNGLADPSVDYWGRYYPKNQYGLNGAEPHIGKWNGDYFYRAAETILDVHVRVGVPPPPPPPPPPPNLPELIFRDSFESGGVGAWSTWRPRRGGGP